MDQKATAANLHHTFDSIINQLAEGDVFYFHFSGHGQQVAEAALAAARIVEARCSAQHSRTRAILSLAEEHCLVASHLARGV